MKQPQLSSFTPSPATHPFNPTRVFYIHTHPNPSSSLTSTILGALSPSGNSKKEDSSKIDIFDITSSALTTRPELDLNLKAQLTDPTVKAHELVGLVPKLEHLARESERPFVRVAQGGWYNRFFEATSVPAATTEEDQEEGAEAGGRGEVLARLDGRLVDMGHWKLTFPSSQSGDDGTVHEIELRPTGPGSTTDVFVLNSVPYIWEMVHGREVFRLWRCSMADDGGHSENANKDRKGARREVAVYIARNARTAGKEGVLVVDDGGIDGGEGREGGGVDILAAIMTCLGTVNRSDSFRK